MSASARLAACVAAAFLCACGVSSVAIDEDGRIVDTGAGDDADHGQSGDAREDNVESDTIDDESDAVDDNDGNNTDADVDIANDAAADANDDATHTDAATDANDAPDQLASDVAVDAEVPPIECDDDTVCGRECVDLASDPANCGFCGVTCIIPNAEAICLESTCAIGRCDFGFFDADNNIATGCELEDRCIGAQPCTTECGTSSVTSCVGGVAVCNIPAELCNLVDDNCNGSCDEGPVAGCRVGIHRANGNGHVYSDDLAFVSRAPYSLEATNFFYLYTAPGFGMRPVFLCRKPDGRRLLSTDTACEVGVEPERQIGFWSPSPVCGAVPLYRLYREAEGNHFFTTSEPERNNARDNLGYLDEGIAGYVWTSP